MSETKWKTATVETEDRARGAALCVDALGRNPFRNRDVLIKPNFNTADPPPASTHNDTLFALVQKIWDMGASTVSLGERSYTPTGKTMEQKGVLDRLAELDVRVIDFDRLAEKDWVETDAPDSAWPDGFRIARPVLEAESLVFTCCLKTHAFGGVFTMSLKLAVGTVPTARNGFDYMSLLHTSSRQRRMIAEINHPFSPDLVLLDGVDAFVDGGPAVGVKARGNLMAAGADRVSVDAVGLAALKLLGANRAVADPPIFAQEQIARAVELGLGATGPENIELVPADQASTAYTEKLREVLDRG